MGVGGTCFVYYESRKRELKIRLMNEGRCDERLKTLRYENRPANRPANRETGLEMPCCPASDLLWVQITRSYPNRLRFWRLPFPESPCHGVIDPRLQKFFGKR